MVCVISAKDNIDVYICACSVDDDDVNHGSGGAKHSFFAFNLNALLFDLSSFPKSFATVDCLTININNV